MVHGADAPTFGDMCETAEKKGVRAVIMESEIAELQLRILPSGGERVVQLLNQYRERVTTTSVTLENVPLLIIARHGMIARLPVDGAAQKLSQTAAILEGLQRFFKSQETLYLYVNLPELPIPPFVGDVIAEVAQRVNHKEELRKQIDRAIDSGDRAAFLELAKKWRVLP